MPSRKWVHLTCSLSFIVLICPSLSALQSVSGPCLLSFTILTCPSYLLSRKWVLHTHLFSFLVLICPSALYRKWVPLACLPSFTDLTSPPLCSPGGVWPLSHAPSFGVSVLTYLSLCTFQTVCASLFLVFNVLSCPSPMCFPECELSPCIWLLLAFSLLPFSLLQALLSKLSSFFANVLFLF